VVSQTVWFLARRATPLSMCVYRPSKKQTLDDLPE